MSESRIYLLKASPISVNDAYTTPNWYRGRGTSRMITDDARALKERVTQMFQLQDEQFYDKTKFQLQQEYRYLYTRYLFLFKRSSLFAADGPDALPYAKDISNYFKLIEDAFHEYIGIDDRYVTSIEGHRGLSKDVLGVDQDYIVVMVHKKREDSIPSHISNMLQQILASHIPMIDNFAKLIG